MKIWLTRHGQTNLNKAHRMQGRIDEPLNDTGVAQAQQMRQLLEEAYPGLVFDAVYASPLQRAVRTGAIIGGVDTDRIILDERLIEADFGRYDKKNYALVGPRMMLYWGFPEVFPTAPTAESTKDMISRAHSFLNELEGMDYENVLVACHGGIMRVLRGYLEDNPRGYRWRPRPHNCEVMVYESAGGKHRLIDQKDLH